jgi:uncharacterized Zn finger protein (UPF0148 family)
MGKIKYNMSISGDNYKENLKHGAEFLIKGGTLLSESCAKCNGLQVKKNNEITCIICGNTNTVEEEKTKKDIENTIESTTGINMSKKIEKRLDELIMSIGSDKNFVEEEQRLRVIDNYLKILEKIKFLN